MSYNIFNKKKWTEELDNITQSYVDIISEALQHDKKGFELDIILSKKYRYNNLNFTGQEIVDNIRKMLAKDTNYTYEFKTVDDSPVISRDYRIFSDTSIKARVEDIEYKDKSGNIHHIKNDNVLITIEDLKSKLMKSIQEIEKLKTELETKTEENYKLFLDIVEASDGLYGFVTKKKWILMLSRILKEFNYYDKDKGVEHSYLSLDEKKQKEVLAQFYNKVYK